MANKSTTATISPSRCVLLKPLLLSISFLALVFISLNDFSSPSNAYNASVAKNMLIYCCILALSLIPKRKAITPAKNSCLVVIALCATFAASTILSSNFEASFERLTLYYACIGTGILYFYCAKTTDSDLLGHILLGICLVHAYFFFELIFSALSTPRPLRIYLILHHFSHIRNFTHFGYIASCAAVGLLVLHNNRGKLLPTVLLFFPIYAILQFGARAPLLAWLLLLVLISSLKLIQKKILSSILIVMLSASAAVFLVNAKIPLEERVYPSIFERIEKPNTAYSDSGRINIWLDSINAAKTRPLFGHGPDAYRLSHCCQMGTIQPHNSVIQFFFEFGLVGLGQITLITFFGLKRAFLTIMKHSTTQRDTTGVKFLSAFLVSSLSFSMVDGLLYHAIPMLNLTIAASLLATEVESFMPTESLRLYPRKTPSK